MSIIKGGKWWRFRLRMQLSCVTQSSGGGIASNGTHQGWHRTGTLTDDGDER